MRTIVVTGGAGFIGRALCEELLRHSYKVIVLDNLSGEGSRFPEGVEAHYVDLSVRQELPKAHLYYHLAASFANQRSVDNPAGDAQDNIISTVNVARFCGEQNIPLVYTGSSSSYGYHGVTPMEETVRCMPSTPYALSKYVGEHYVKMLTRRHLILRLFNVFGEGDIPGEYRNAIPRMVQAGMRDGVIPVYNPKAARDFTYIEDVVRALFKLGRWCGRQDMDPVVNIASGIATPLLEVAKEIRVMLAANGYSSYIDVQESRGWDKVITRVGSTRLLDKYLPSLSMEMQSGFYLNLRRTIRWLIRHESA